MLILMIEQRMPVDDILFFDWGKEFAGMRSHLEQVQHYVWRHLRKEITIIHPRKPFEYWLIEHKKSTRANNTDPGYGFPRNTKNRWCTRIKVDSINHITRDYRKQGYQVFQYIGFAYDEFGRSQSPFFRKHPHFYFPLITQRMTERTALDLCYSRGFTWDGLYSYFSRLSCYCCPLQNLQELKKLYQFFPEHWEELKVYEKQTYNTFRAGTTLEELETRFSWIHRQHDFLSPGCPGHSGGRR